MTTMSVLFSDYRFNFYIIFHRRVLGLWISLSILLLLCLLFSGWTGGPLFTGGMLWLLLNALGIFAAIYVKQKVKKGLKNCQKLEETHFFTLYYHHFAAVPHAGGGHRPGERRPQQAQRLPGAGRPRPLQLPQGGAGLCLLRREVLHCKHFFVLAANPITRRHTHTHSFPFDLLTFVSLLLLASRRSSSRTCSTTANSR